MTADVSRLILRAPRTDDRDAAFAAQAELAAEGFDFLMADEDQSWEQYLAMLERERGGVGLSDGAGPATMLFAEVDGVLVGRAHLRHALTPRLRTVGGHVGYAVRPAHRRRGYATDILRQALGVLRSEGVVDVLVTCDDDNRASIGTIEANGGVLEDVITLPNGTCKRRYWIHG